MGCSASQDRRGTERDLSNPLDVWQSRRSPVFSTQGVCCSSQPLASAIGSQILNAGGTAADACVAMAAALNVTEPTSTGIGGDAFCHFYDARTKKVTCLQGNGATSEHFSLKLLNERGIGMANQGMVPLELKSGLCVTVPGSAMLWEDAVKEFGCLSLQEVLEPAIKLAREGFPVSPVAAYQWAYTFNFIQGNESHRIFKPNGEYPKPGQVFFNPDLADTFESLARNGAKEGFYRGRIAKAIVQAVKDFDGVLDLDDLDTHTTAREDPISKVYRGYRIYETPPPTHGLAVLIALGIYEKVIKYDDSASASNRGSIEETHVMLECMRLGMADALHHVCDPFTSTKKGEPGHDAPPVDVLLSDDYLAERAKLIDTKALQVDRGDTSPYERSDTCYFCAIDKYGNGCSMINSNYLGFGTGITPKGCGFTLQNRGHNFSLDPTHPNAVGPRKRPYHTIIPGLITRADDDSLFAVFGNMGGFMQPQGHMQLIRNLIDLQMNPQAALDAKRWYIDGAGTNQAAKDVEKSVIRLEEGYGDRRDATGNNECTSLDDGKRMMKGLLARGHVIKEITTGFGKEIYGRGQIITLNGKTGVICGGSDPRADGCAVPSY